MDGVLSCGKTKNKKLYEPFCQSVELGLVDQIQKTWTLLGVIYFAMPKLV